MALNFAFFAVVGRGPKLALLALSLALGGGIEEKILQTGLALTANLKALTPTVVDLAENHAGRRTNTVLNIQKLLWVAILDAPFLHPVDVTVLNPEALRLRHAALHPVAVYTGQLAGRAGSNADTLASGLFKEEEVCRT